MEDGALDSLNRNEAGASIPAPEPRTLGHARQQTVAQQLNLLAQVADATGDINFATSTVAFMARLGDKCIGMVHVTQVEPAPKTRREAIESDDSKV